MTWEERLREILEAICALYTGAPCNWGDSTISEDIAHVHGQWKTQGCSPLTQAVLSDLQTHLALAGNNLSQSDDDDLDEIVNACIASS